MLESRRKCKRYAKQYKRGKVIVLKVIIDTSSQTTYIDLDDPVFMREWSKIREQLEHRANNIWKKYSTGSAKRRHNIDGILLELAIRCILQNRSTQLCNIIIHSCVMKKAIV